MRDEKSSAIIECAFAFEKKKTALWRKNMIAFIKGTVDSLSEGKMILESHGIGYELNIPASMFDAGIREGEELKIYTHMSVREDGISLFGFLSREDLEIYRMLIGVSGIGPKAALAVLSTLTADNLRFAVLSEDVQAIAKTPGIGKKTAQKLILELKDKFDLQEAFEQKLAGKSGGCGGTAGRRTGCLPGCGTGADCAWLLRNGSTAGSKKVEITEGMDSEAVLKAALKHMF